MNSLFRNNTDLVQRGSRRNGTATLVMSPTQLIDRTSLDAMIGDGLARIIAGHLRKKLLSNPRYQKHQQIGNSRPEEENRR